MGKPTEHRAPSDCAKGFYLCRWQDEIGLDDLRRIWNAGYRYVHIRASVGRLPDSSFPRHFDNAGRVGFLRSAFHYLTADEWGQAKVFYQSVGGRRPEMGLYGDFEASKLIIDKCNMFFKAADDWFGETVNYYTGAWWLNARRKTGWEKQGRLIWLGDIGQLDDLPNGVSTYEFWQHGFGRIKPFPCVVGLDRYNGTLEELYGKYRVP